MTDRTINTFNYFFNSDETPRRRQAQGNARLDKKALMHVGNILTVEQLLFPFMVKLKLVAGYFKKYSSKWELQKKNLIGLNNIE